MKYLCYLFLVGMFFSTCFAGAESDQVAKDEVREVEKDEFKKEDNSLEFTSTAESTQGEPAIDDEDELLADKEVFDQKAFAQFAKMLKDGDFDTDNV